MTRDGELLARESGALDTRPPELPPAAEWLANFTSRDTRRAYKADLADFLGFIGTDALDFATVTRSQVLAWRERCRLSGCSASTVARKLAALASLFDHLLERGVVAANPVTGVRRPRVPRAGSTPSLSDAQVRRLLAAPPAESLKGLRDRAILATLVYHGLRRAELCRLRVRDLARDRGVTILRIRGKGGTSRALPAHPAALTRIDAYLAGAGQGEDLDGALFRPVRAPRSGTLARALHPDSVYRHVVRRYGAQVGINAEVIGFCTHSLRATAATHALEQGADLTEVQHWLGHADISTTRRHYDKRRQQYERSPTLRMRF